MIESKKSRQLEMINFLRQLENPQINAEKIFEVMRDFRKGGLNPLIYNDFAEAVKGLPNINSRQPTDYKIFDTFNLIDISKDDSIAIMREVRKRGIAKSKKCWHPESSPTTCKVDRSGNIIVSAAHSIQNNGVLSKVADNGYVMSYALDKGEFDGVQLGKNHASIFWGFCNTHDAIFSPIEIKPYSGSDEQHFLFAYRGFVVASHEKIEVSNWINYSEQSGTDIAENRKIFDAAILSQNYSVIKTEVFELPRFYPIAVSSSFYLDFDFEGNSIPHSEERMENIYVTLLPTGNKTYFFLSYFKMDENLYGILGDQIRNRNNLKSDITMLIAAHTDNVYFNPTYYENFIKKHETQLETIVFHSQMDYATVAENDELNVIVSFTPRNYLDNPYDINFFGY